MKLSYKELPPVVRHIVNLIFNDKHSRWDHASYIADTNLGWKYSIKQWITFIEKYDRMSPMVETELFPYMFAAENETIS